MAEALYHIPPQRPYSRRSQAELGNDRGKDAIMAPMNLPASARSRRPSQNKRRGFTLIEIAIAMMVIGALLGATAVTVRALEERRQFKNEISRMETIRDAIIGYAIRNRTRARTIEFVPYYFRDFTPDFTLPSRVFHLPAGRPYLPCPDWDGDGYEDRFPEGEYGFRQGIEVQPNLDITATITQAVRRLGNYPHLHLIRWDADIRLHLTSQPHGDCVVARGGVPWRTLGVHPADRWGNRHTYYADPVFSNAVFGFDRQTVADVFDPRIPDSPGFLRAPRRFFLAGAKRGNTLANGCPSTICNGIHAGNCWQHDYHSGSSQAVECTWGDVPPFVVNRPTPPYEMLVLKAGAATKEAWHNGGRKHFPPGAVTDGLPFVLVSHGPNGNYAVNHWATLQNPKDEDGNLTPVCNWRISENSNIVSPDNRGRIHEAVNGSRIAPNHEFSSLLSRPPPPPTARCPQMGWTDYRVNRFNPSFFVWEPPGDEFDDLLMWMTREELTTNISGDIPKLPTMVVPYFDFD